ncbi:MAG: aminotransferase class V-fold PLP-dependent enzyme, partial [Chloroflexota bacterium]|nr:aminotransferase class V-fold PLP-dependent enzyme [Chloroflexota bacterium]
MLDRLSIERIRHEMPATTSRTYLNTGTFGPLPNVVLEAVMEHLSSEYHNGRLGLTAFETMSTIYQNARQSVARLFNAEEQEIALTDNTGEGLNIICHGINWQQGDEVITTNHEHISALAPLYQMRDRYGVVLRIADLGPTGDQPAAEAIRDQITARTRLIVVSHVLWTTGTVLDVNAIGTLGREHGIPVLIDGAQSAGVVPLDMKTLNVDFYAIPMQKWLCGPDGTGALYVRREALHAIHSTYVGYFSMKHEEGIEWELLEHAQRFELGGRQTSALAGQAAGLNWLEKEVGYQNIFERISSLHSYAYKALQTLPGLTMLTPKAGGSGLLSFTLEGHDVTEVVQQLQEQHNIYIRNIPNMKSLRVSTGFYNTEEEIDTLM